MHCCRDLVLYNMDINIFQQYSMLHIHVYWVQNFKNKQLGFSGPGHQPPMQYKLTNNISLGVTHLITINKHFNIQILYIQ